MSLTSPKNRPGVKGPPIRAVAKKKIDSLPQDLQNISPWRHDALMLNADDICWLVVHCSDTPDEEGLRARDIHAMHLGFGWDGTGYHKIICRDGRIENGRPEYWQGAHVKGRNTDTLGVCLIGRSNFSNAQMTALQTVLFDWKARYPKARVTGHRDIQDTPKTCPNFDAGQWWAHHDPVQTRQAVVMSDCAPLLDQPPKEAPATDTRSAIQTECLYGETVEIISQAWAGPFLRAKLKTDGYTGWIEARHIAVCTDPHGQLRKISVPSALVTAQPDVKSAPLMRLTMGACVQCLSETDSDGYLLISLPGRSGTDQTGWLPVSAVAVPQDWVAAAESFIGCPYKWGGRSAGGLDCSALIQLALASTDRQIPRDSTPQLAFFQKAARDRQTAGKDFARGDILFWDGHVGVCTGPDMFLHANAWHQCTALETTEQALKRIGPPRAHIDAARADRLFNGR